MLFCADSMVAKLIEHIKMKCSNSDKETNIKASPKCGPPQRTQPSPVSATSSRKHRRSSADRILSLSRQRQEFLQHLMQWSLDYDSSPYFHGKICLLPPGSTREEQYELGSPVRCILVDKGFSDARQTIVIKLYAPQPSVSASGNDAVQRRDSMEPICENKCDRTGTERPVRTSKTRALPRYRQNRSRPYKLVVRCGAGWVPAREYLNKVYFTRKALGPGHKALEVFLEKKSRVFGSMPPDQDAVIIRPLFRPFLRLPPELRDLVLREAAGLSRTYNLCTSDYGMPMVKKSDICSPISLATLLLVSKSINYHLMPHIFHSTGFEFGLTGFTNFLWQIGPVRRPQVRYLTFHFGKMALLHCIRWLAPDTVFSLLEPPVATNPRALQYFWRCQIQDLAKELHLLSITINIREIPPADLSMVCAILKIAFGSVERIRFMETDANGETMMVKDDDERLREVTLEATWRDLCWGYYKRHQKYSYFLKFELLRTEEDDVRRAMDKGQAFFDSLAIS